MTIDDFLYWMNRLHFEYYNADHTNLLCDGKFKKRKNEKVIVRSKDLSVSVNLALESISKTLWNEFAFLFLPDNPVNKYYRMADKCEWALYRLDFVFPVRSDLDIRWGLIPHERLQSRVLDFLWILEKLSEESVIKCVVDYLPRTLEGDLDVHGKVRIATFPYENEEYQTFSIIAAGGKNSTARITIKQELVERIYDLEDTLLIKTDFFTALDRYIKDKNIVWDVTGLEFGLQISKSSPIHYIDEKGLEAWKFAFTGNEDDLNQIYWKLIPSGTCDDTESDEQGRFKYIILKEDNSDIVDQVLKNYPQVKVAGICRQKCENGSIRIWQVYSGCGVDHIERQYDCNEFSQVSDVKWYQFVNPLIDYRGGPYRIRTAPYEYKNMFIKYEFRFREDWEN